MELKKHQTKITHTQTIILKINQNFHMETHNQTIELRMGQTNKQTHTRIQSETGGCLHAQI